MGQDENDKSGQDDPQAKAGLTSAGKSPTSGKPEKVTVTKEALRQMVSDEAAKAGRPLKAENVTLTSQLTDTRTALEENQVALRQVQREIREGKLDRNDPNAIKLFQQQEEIVTLRDNLERDTRTNKARKAELDEQAKGIAEERIATIAETYGVDAEDLRSLGIINREALIKYAKAIAPQKEGDKEGAKGKGEGAEGKDFVPDTNTQSGEKADTLELTEEEQKEIKPAELARRMKAKNPDML